MIYIYFVHVIATWLGYLLAGVGVFSLMRRGKANKITASIVAVIWALVSVYLRVIENHEIMAIIDRL